MHCVRCRKKVHDYKHWSFNPWFNNIPGLKADDEFRNFILCNECARQLRIWLNGEERLNNGG